MKIKIFKQPEIKDLALRFTRYAWGKLVYVNELSTTEISGFCIANSNDLLLVEDIAFLQQVNTGASTLLDDEAVADHFDDQVDAGRKPNQFARIWLHTHPNHHQFGRHNQFGRKTRPKHRNCSRCLDDDFCVPTPSGTDENTIRQAFGSCDWAVMFIYSGGSTGYARLVLKKPVNGQIVMPVVIQKKGKNPTKKDFAEWKQEFEKNITAKVWIAPVGQRVKSPLPSQYIQLLEIVDADIDVDEFARYIELEGETVGGFCQLNEQLRQFWMDEFRKDKELSTQHIIRNPY